MATLFLTGNGALCGALPGTWATSGVVEGTGTGLGAACGANPAPPLPAGGAPRAALFAVRLSTNSTWPAGLDSSWQFDTDPCGSTAWAGVTCSGGSVVRLDLSLYNMQVRALTRPGRMFNLQASGGNGMAVACDSRAAGMCVCVCICNQWCGLAVSL